MRGSPSSRRQVIGRIPTFLAIPRCGCWPRGCAVGDRASLGAELRLEQAAQQVAQPFDAPTDAALAVYLHADTSAIQGPTRLRVQVGIKGAERHGGHRPAMNIGLVVDARDLSDDRIGARVRALITALVRIRQPGDKFSLTAAGPAGGMLVAPEQFRHGPLRVAMEQLFGDATAAGADSVALIDAVALASESVRQGDDPNAVLGASLVLLATGASIAGDLDALERLAHAGAVGGVPLSVVRLSDRAELDDIDRLVAAGQGNRRILDTADQADALIDRELHSASRAVARAVRLRIKLAPGVKLVEVLGSRRLEVVQAERVREAELALDQRLARNLGIEADRGDDEEGIQIVIPSFYAGDAHVILLDGRRRRPRADRRRDGALQGHCLSAQRSRQQPPDDRCRACRAWSARAQRAEEPGGLGAVARDPAGERHPAGRQCT